MQIRQSVNCQEKLRNRGEHEIFYCALRWSEIFSISIVLCEKEVNYEERRTRQKAQGDESMFEVLITRALFSRPHAAASNKHFFFPINRAN